MVGLSSSTSAPPQVGDTQSTIKALYIYTFATLVEWPPDRQTGNFVIGVYGDNFAVYDELYEKYSNKSIGSQKIIIENYTTKNAINKCHILYVSEENTSQIPSLSSQLASKNTLIVADRTGALSKGATVNFIIEGNQQKYEINKKNAKKHKLVIADKLSDLAANVIK